MNIVSQDVYELIQQLLTVVKDPSLHSPINRMRLVKEAEKLKLQTTLPTRVPLVDAQVLDGVGMTMSYVGSIIVFDQTLGDKPFRLFLGLTDDPLVPQIFWTTDSDLAYSFARAELAQCAYDGLCKDVPCEIGREKRHYPEWALDLILATPSKYIYSGILRVIATGAQIVHEEYIQVGRVHVSQVNVPKVFSKHLGDVSESDLVIIEEKSLSAFFPPKIELPSGEEQCTLPVVNQSDVSIAVQLDLDVTNPDGPARFYSIEETTAADIYWGYNSSNSWKFSEVTDAEPIFEMLINYRQRLKGGQLMPPDEVISALKLGPDRQSASGRLYLLDRNGKILHSAAISASIRPEEYHNSGQA